VIGDAAATDPACSLSPHHNLVEVAREDAVRPAPALQYRQPQAPAVATTPRG
jgi:pyrroloquinoline quinone biosynthesis protein E